MLHVARQSVHLNSCTALNVPISSEGNFQYIVMKPMLPLSANFKIKNFLVLRQHKRSQHGVQRKSSNKNMDSFWEKLMIKNFKKSYGHAKFFLLDLSLKKEGIEFPIAACQASLSLWSHPNWIPCLRTSCVQPQSTSRLD